MKLFIGEKNVQFDSVYCTYHGHVNAHDCHGGLRSVFVSFCNMRSTVTFREIKMLTGWIPFVHRIFLNVEAVREIS